MHAELFSPQLIPFSYWMWAREFKEWIPSSVVKCDKLPPLNAKGLVYPAVITAEPSSLGTVSLRNCRFLVVIILSVQKLSFTKPYISLRGCCELYLTYRTTEVRSLMHLPYPYKPNPYTFVKVNISNDINKLTPQFVILCVPFPITTSRSYTLLLRACQEPFPPLPVK